MRFSLACLLLLLCPGLVSGADDPEALELQFRYAHAYVSFVINEDGTSVETHDWSMNVLKEAALQWGKSTSVSYSTSAQKAEVIAAFTRKANGERIDVPKENYQIQSNQGQGNNAPAYSDMTSITVVFPDLVVGDSIGFSYRITQTDPLFPGHYSMAQDYPAGVAIDDAKVRIEYPPALWVQYESRGMVEKEKSEHAGRKVLEWTYSHPRPLKDSRRNFSVYDPGKEDGFSFSTFKTHADIAKAYGVRALPKAAVTDGIEKLAADIVRDAKDKKAQARALYDWVARNITYAGNCIGVGAVVPREVPVVLENKMGDCKDHATLLQALLAARGIRSTQALINAGTIYKLPKVPVVGMVNHVINYIPEFDLFLDSTSDSTPFGMLPFQVADKPVLLVEGHKEGLKTPAWPIGADKQRLQSAMRIADSGAISGTVKVFQEGHSAAQVRAWARSMSKEAESDFVKNYFKQQGLIATGKLDKDDPTARIDSYKFSVDMNVEKFIKIPGPGAFHIYPLMNGGGSIQHSIGGALNVELTDDEEVACSSTTITEEYSIELPASVKILSIPDDVKIANEAVSYQATYLQQRNVLTVKRDLDDKTKGNVCSARYFAEYRKISEKIMEDLKSQVLYK